MSAVTVGIACEDNGHFFAVTCLVDATLVAHHRWLDGILDDCRSWHGLTEGVPWYKFDPADANDLRPFDVGGTQIKLQGHIKGRPLKPEASMWRKVLLMFCRYEPRPDVVILARDMDGYPERLAGVVQVRDGLEWPFRVAVAMPEPEVEAWVVSGFVAGGQSEEEALTEIRRLLSFDPTLESHRLTSHPNHAPTDSKRILAHLCEEDAERKSACLANRRLLHERGERNGLRSFLAEIDQHVVPLFGEPR